MYLNDDYDKKYNRRSKRNGCSRYEPRKLAKMPQRTVFSGMANIAVTCIGFRKNNFQTKFIG